MKSVFFLFVILLLYVKSEQNCSLENTLCNLCSKRRTTDDLSEIKRNIKELQRKTKPVAFFAYLSQQKSTGSNLKYHTIVYDKVDLNIGDGYDKTTGKFTAPSDGLYVFHIATGVYDRSWATVELVLEGVVKDITFADSGNHDDRNFVTTATPLSLKRGNIVYARIGVSNGGKYIESNQYTRTSFSGVKIN